MIASFWEGAHTSLSEKKNMHLILHSSTRSLFTSLQ